LGFGFQLGTYEKSLLNITISLGVAAFPTHGREMDMLIRQGGNNLYLAKKSDRNQALGKRSGVCTIFHKPGYNCNINETHLSDSP
jgi:PleD family two-component response regulator